MRAGVSCRPSKAAAAAILGVLAAGACSGGPTQPDQPAVATVEVSPVADTLEAFGETRQLTATARDGQGQVVTGKSFTWSSEAPAVVTVTEAGGLATAVGNGETTVTATVDGVSGATMLAVSQQVSSVVVTPSAAAFTTVGVTEQLSASATDANGNTVADARFLWISSEPSVATVDSAGVVTARGVGSSLIAAAAHGVPGYAEVTVTQVAAVLAFSVQPSAVDAGDEISPAIQVEIHDDAGALVSGARDPVSLSAIDDVGTSVPLYGTGTVNAVAGIATFSGLSGRESGSLRLAASASGMTSDTSQAFVVSPGPAAELTLQTAPPATVEAGATIAPAVEAAVADAYGNAISGIDVAMTVAEGPSSSHELGGTTTQTTTGGVATFADLVLVRPGPYALSAEAGSIGSPSADLFVTMTVTQVAVGTETSCAIAVNDTYCWGDNDTGKLGAVTAADVDSLPLPVSGTQTFTEITVGTDHTCGLDAAGAVYCWGNNGFGQLGDGGVVNNVTTPTLVQGSGSGSLVFTSVSAGSSHTCGVTTNLEAYCWGENSFGQLGDSTNTLRNVPTRVAGGTTAFTKVSAGAFHSCAVDATDAAHCWGWNADGQLGTGVANTGTNAPVAVSGGFTFAEVHAGTDYTCAIRETSAGVYCWGTNTYGQLGDGTNTRRLEPWPVAAEATSLGVGESHSCAIDTLGEAYCWGRNHRGQLGNGTSTDASTPTPVLSGRAWSHVSVGYWHTCAVSDGVVYCWGSNDRGELGDGSTAVRAEPVRVAG